MSESWSTFSEIAEVTAAALRVFVLENPESGIDAAQPYVRMRVEEAAETLSECAERLAALEDFFIAVGESGSKLYETLAQCSSTEEEIK